MSEIYSSLKAFQFPEHLQALKDGKLLAPVHVRIKPINACNHNCWYCAYRSEQLELGSLMKLRDRIPAEKMNEIVEDLIAMKVRAVTFSGGGEPLIYPGIAGIVEKLAQGDVQVATLTNGAFLKGEVADVFARHGTWVRVSMDGWDGTSYAQSRGVKETEFSKVMGNLSDFSARSPRALLGASFIISRRNFEHITDFCRQAKEVGVRNVKLSACVVGNSACENNEYHDPIREQVRSQIEVAKKLLTSPTFQLIDHYHAMTERFEKSYRRCPYLQFLVVIGADCRVYTCQDKAYTDSGCLGSIQNRRFKEFWFSEENERAVRALDPSRDCRHHCVSHAKNELLTEYLALDPNHAPFT